MKNRVRGIEATEQQEKKDGVTRWHAGDKWHVATKRHGVMSSSNRGRVSKQVDEAIDSLNARLTRLEAECAASGADMEALHQKLARYIHLAEQACHAADLAFKNDPDQLEKLRNVFRDRTDRFFSKSYFMNRARTWPQGYPGDYEIIDKAYDNCILSNGIGDLLDRYFLNATLANAIRERRILMRDILDDAMQQHENARLLNIGCGPCREVMELAPTIAATNARLTCVDFDQDALEFSRKRMTLMEIDHQVGFKQYNALRMISAKNNVKQFGRQDIIYTIGLLDYLTDDVLKRMLGALYQSLTPGGIFVAVFKDATQYETPDYHWLVHWDGFYQRTAAHSRQLVRDAGIPDDAVALQKTPSSVMVFYRITRQAELRSDEPKQGPHRRPVIATTTKRQ